MPGPFSPRFLRPPPTLHAANARVLARIEALARKPSVTLQDALIPGASRSLECACGASYIAHGRALEHVRLCTVAHAIFIAAGWRLRADYAWARA